MLGLEGGRRGVLFAAIFYKIILKQGLTKMLRKKKKKFWAHIMLSEFAQHSLLYILVYNLHP